MGVGVEKSWWRANRKGLIVAGCVVGGVVLLTTVMGGGDESTPAATSSEPQVTVEDASRCVKVPSAVLKELGTGLTDGWAVRSDDYKKVWFVGARYVNSYPVFSVTGDPRSRDTAFGGMVLAVNDDARDFSSFPFGPDTPARITMDGDGAREAQLCAMG